MLSPGINIRKKHTAVPVKFDNCGVNVAGIQYRVHSIGIGFLLLNALGGALTQITKISKIVFLLLIA